MHWFRRDNRVHRINVNSKTTIDYFQNRRWQLVAFIERSSGFWPQQSKLQQCPLQLIHYFLWLTIFSAALNKFPVYAGVDADKTLEGCIFILFLLGMLVKLMIVSMHQSDRLKIYETIVEHFDSIDDPEEAAVLNEAAEKGFMYHIKFMIGLLTCVVIFDTLSALRSFYRYYFNTHSELGLHLPVELDFGFDHNKYWYVIAIDFTVWVGSCCFFEIAYDLSFALQVRHVDALFEIVGIRLKRASELVDAFENVTMSDEAADEAYSLISSAIDLHSKCLGLIYQMEEYYSKNCFLILLVSSSAFGAGVHLIATKFHDPIEAFRYSSAFMTILLHFQMIFFQGQLIVDSSKGVSDACYDCKWYGLPRKSCQLLSVMMMRASRPCQLTGAKLFLLNMETFSKMLKGGLSYYTVFEA